MRGENQGRSGKNRVLILLGLLSLSVTMIIFVVCRFMYSVIEKRTFGAMVRNTTEMMEVIREVSIENLVFHLDDSKREIAEYAQAYGDVLLDGEEEEITAALSAIPLPEYGLDYIFFREDEVFCGRDTPAAEYTEEASGAWAGATIIGGPGFRTDGVYTMTFSAPVTRDGQVRGVLSVVLDGFCLSEWIADVQFAYGGGMAYIVNEEGTNIADSTEFNRDWVTDEYNAQELAKHDEQSKTVADLELQALQGITGDGSYLWEGGRSYLAFAPVPGTGWGFYVGFYGEVMHQYALEVTASGITHNQIYLAALVLILCVISIVEIRWIGREQQSNKTLTEQQEALIALQKKTEEQAGLLKAHHETILSSLDYARKIQGSLLPGRQECQGPLSEFGLIWSPKDAVGGDLYWIQHYLEGSLLCVCDCTGHGIPGAMLTMLVADALDSIVDEGDYQDPAKIMYLLDRRLASVLNNRARQEGEQSQLSHIRDGADLALIYIGRDNSITFAAGNTHVFVCDGETVKDYKGQRLHIGEGTLETKEQVEVISVPADGRNRYYAASDGYFDQVGEHEKRSFGYRQFKQVILEHHADPMDTVMEELWAAFESYRGTQERRDDVEMVGFRA